MEKRWSKTEVAHLKRHASTKSLEELAQRLHTDTETVRHKLAELGLTSSGAGTESDAAFERFNQAVDLFHRKQWAEAGAELEAVIAASDAAELVDRSQQYLNICRRHTEKGPSWEDPYLQAVFEKNEGNYQEALRICEEQADNDERFLYLLASLRALAGETQDAIEKLAEAIRLEPKNRIHAYHDPDFADLRGREEFAKLLAGA